METPLGRSLTLFFVGSVTGATLGTVAEGFDTVSVAGLINRVTGTVGER